MKKLILGLSVIIGFSTSLKSSTHSSSSSDEDQQQYQAVPGTTHANSQSAAAARRDLLLKSNSSVVSTSTNHMPEVDLVGDSSPAQSASTVDHEALMQASAAQAISAETTAGHRSSSSSNQSSFAAGATSTHILQAAGSTKALNDINLKTTESATYAQAPTAPVRGGSDPYISVSSSASSAPASSTCSGCCSWCNSK